MSTDVIPAIDVAAGGLARYTPHGPAAVHDAFGGDPLAAAQAFVDAGARWIHVVDMDLAFGGRAENIPIVAEIARMPVRVQASGGVVAQPEVEAMLEAGADRVVLGSSALGDLGRLNRLLARHGARLAVGVEVEGDDRIRSRGRQPVDLPFDETMEGLAAISPPRVVVTNVGRVGGLTGPDVATLERVHHFVACPILAAGGIASVADVELAASVAGVDGVVVGRAAYGPEFDLREAIAAVG